MAFESNSTAFSVEAQLLVEASGVRCSETPCKPLRPTSSQLGNNSSTTDSGFFPLSDTGSNSLQLCSVSLEMIRLSKTLLHFYYDRKISADDAPVNVRSMFGDAEQNNAIDTFLTSVGIISTNSWTMGGQVASYVLNSFPEPKENQNCELESDVEAYLSRILSIASSRDSSPEPKCAAELCKHSHKEIPRCSQLTQLSHPHSSTFLSWPTSPTKELRFVQNHRRSRSSKSMSPMPWTCSVSSTTPYKGTPASPTIFKDFGAQGCFTITSPARRTLRSVVSQSSNPRASYRPPIPWSLEIPGHGVPTTSRTSSVTDTATSSEGPMTPSQAQLSPDDDADKEPTPRAWPFVHERAKTLPVCIGRSAKQRTSEMNPILARVELESKFRARTKCSGCHKVGLDFPKCPRCQAMWCSRECRLPGGKRHVCVRV